MVWWSSR